MIDEAKRLPKPTESHFLAELEEVLRRHARAINEATIPAGVDRPANPRPYSFFVDLTEGKLIMFDGTDWVNPDGSSL